MIFTVLFYSFVVITVIQVIYYLLFSSFTLKRDKEEAQVSIPISVIIYVKNCANKLENYIQEINQQDYSNFELVIVNNASSDSTLDILENLQEKNENIKIVNVKNTEAFWGNKKYALTLGIKAATHEHLLFTELSSMPISKNWIQEIALKFSQEKSVIIGYKKPKYKKFSFINLLIRFDNLIYFTKAFSFAKLKTPFTATNNNLAYTKSEFFRVNGFIKHLNLHLGEDDLFIKDVATKNNTTFITSKNSFVESQEILSFKKWFSQKRKGLILFSLYKFKHRFFLTLFSVTKVIFYPLAIYLATLNWQLITPIILIYFLTQYIVIGKSAYKLKEKQVLFFLPLLDICLVLLQIIIFISKKISKPTPWK